MIYIILACLLYAAATVTGAFASRHADVSLASFVINLMSVFLPLGFLVLYARPQPLAHQTKGVWAAILSGLIIGGYVLALTKAYSVNKVGIVTPIVFGGSMLLSTVASYFLYKEKLSGMELIGFGLVLVGVGIVLYARATNA